MNRSAKPGDGNVAIDLARMALRTIYTTGQRWGDDERVLLEYGFDGFDAYWEAALAEPMTPADFAGLVTITHLHPARVADEHARRVARYEDVVETALKTAFDNGEPWFFRTPGGELRLRPMDAARWFLNNPRRRGDLPSSLASFLEGSPRDGAQAAGSGAGLPARADDTAAEWRARPGETLKVWVRRDDVQQEGERRLRVQGAPVNPSRLSHPLLEMWRESGRSSSSARSIENTLRR